MALELQPVVVDPDELRAAFTPLQRLYAEHVDETPERITAMAPGIMAAQLHALNISTEGLEA
jgi:hypothetical protein